MQRLESRNRHSISVSAHQGVVSHREQQTAVRNGCRVEEPARNRHDASATKPTDHLARLRSISAAHAHAKLPVLVSAPSIHISSGACAHLDRDTYAGAWLQDWERAETTWLVTNLTCTTTPQSLVFRGLYDQTKQSSGVGKVGIWVSRCVIINASELWVPQKGLCGSRARTVWLPPHATTRTAWPAGSKGRVGGDVADTDPSPHCALSFLPNMYSTPSSPSSPAEESFQSRMLRVADYGLQNILQ